MNEKSKFFNQKRVTAIFLSLLIVAAFLVGFLVGFLYGYESGRQDIIHIISHHREVLLNLSSPEIQTQLKQLFPRKLNYTELLLWESKRLNYTTKQIERHTNPLDILDYGLGKCGEFSILYVAICLANDIPARLVTGVTVDHAWAEVNPSKDGVTWIHVEPTDSCVRIQHGKSIYDEPATVNNPSLYRNKNFQIVLAFQITENREVIIIDRTSYYTSF